ncbi:rhomboid protease [Ranunculus cassubicifolius]
MEKFKLSIKLLSQIPKTLSAQSPLCKKIISSFTETTPKSFSRVPSSQPLYFSKSIHEFSEKFSGVVGNSVLFRQFLTNEQLKKQSKHLVDQWVLFRSQFPRSNFGVQRFNFNSRRLWMPTTENAILGLIAANVAVFMLWRSASPSFMRKHFMISVENVKSGRLHTVITSAFSHMDLDHLFSNMLGLYFFGSSIGYHFGAGFVLKLYLAGAVGGSIFYLAHHSLISPISKGSFYIDPKKIPALGASGAVNAIMLLNIFLFPKATIYFGLLIPLPAYVVGAILIGSDLWRMEQKYSEISGAAHLGGAFVAAVTWALLKKGMI